MTRPGPKLRPSATLTEGSQYSLGRLRQHQVNSDVTAAAVFAAFFFCRWLLPPFLGSRRVALRRAPFRSFILTQTCWDALPPEEGDEALPERC